MGRLSATMRYFVIETLTGFIKADYLRIARAHINAGILHSDQSPELFAQAMRAIGEPIIGLTANNISLARLLEQLFATTSVFAMETQTDLLLLQKTMVVVEGVARYLDPNINIWHVAGQSLERLMIDRLAPGPAIGRVVDEVKQAIIFFPALLDRLETLLANKAKPVATNNSNFATILCCSITIIAITYIIAVL